MAAMERYLGYRQEEVLLCLQCLQPDRKRPGNRHRLALCHTSGAIGVDALPTDARFIWRSVPEATAFIDR
jgi:hypothetical protein